MKYSPHQYAIALYETLDALSPSQVKKIYRNFISLLVRNNALSLSEKIEKELEEYIREQNNQVLVKVTTTHSLSSEEVKHLKKALKEYTKKEIVLESQTDQSILGGAVLKIKDLVIDGSIRKRLENLKENLIHQK